MIEDLAAALLRASASPNATEGAWADEIPDTIELSTLDEALDAAVGPTGELPPAPEERAPFFVMPLPDGAGTDDLWRLVMAEGVHAPKSSAASVEEAIHQLDARLEALVDVEGLRALYPPPVEAIIEPAFFAPADWAGDNTSQTQDTASEGLRDDSSPFDEEDLATDPSDPAESAKSRRQRMLRRAMTNMGSLRSREESFVNAEPTPAVQGTPEEGAARAPSATPAPDETQLARRIEARYLEMLSGQDRFAALGLPPTASKEQIKAAFLDLAKIYHPDRLPGTLQALAPKMTAIFESVRSAYEILHDDVQRKVYLATLTEPGGGNQKKGPAQVAEETFKRAELAFKKREYASAEEQYARAFELDPTKAVYLAAQGWALYADPARKHEAPRALKLMGDALRADPKCDRAHYQLGVIARVEGDLEKAERCFREAVKHNSKHQDANQELRLMELRRKNNPRKGLFR